MPVLILRGEHSALLTAQTGRWMHRRIHGSIYREISRAYHHVPLDNPSDTADAIGEFIATL
jgi:pimeloyl-ACP methyl ester carboxylesterase